MESKNSKPKSGLMTVARGLAPPSSERGSTLVISLIVLIILMLLGVAAMNTSDTQFKLAGNLQFESIAQNNAETAVAAAEAALGDGVTYLDGRLTTARSADAPGYYPPGTLAAPGSDSVTTALAMTWDDSNSVKFGDTDTDQRYLIETLALDERLPIGTQCIGCRFSGTCNKANTYRIIARGASKRGAVKFVESYFSVMNCQETRLP
jgi:Tfp pilus assembly protein PilX